MFLKCSPWSLHIITLWPFAPLWCYILLPATNLPTGAPLPAKCTSQRCVLSSAVDWPAWLHATPQAPMCRGRDIYNRSPPMPTTSIVTHHDPPSNRFPFFHPAAPPSDPGACDVLLSRAHAPQPDRAREQCRHLRRSHNIHAYAQS